MSLCICMGYESDGADYEVREEAITLGDDTESEHEVESGIEYKFPSDDEETGSESEVDPNDVKDINDEENETGNEEKDNEVPSDEEDKLPDEIKQLLGKEENKQIDKSEDKQLKEIEESSDDEDKLPDVIKQFLGKGKNKVKTQSEKSGDEESGKKGKEENKEAADKEIFPRSLGSPDYHSSEHGSNDPHRRYAKNRYTDVKFPTGNTYSVIVPQAKTTDEKQGGKTKLITLRPDGKIGKREYRIVAKEMEKTRVNHISGSFSGYEIVKIQKIVNPCLWKKYRQRRKEVMRENHDDPNERMLFHGSPAYHEMIEKGFDERFASTNGMFGAGLYFARNSSKSNQYVYGLNGGTGCPTHKVKYCMICERTLILCRVALGRTKTFRSAQRLAHAPVGYHSVEGVPTPGGLAYSETIVYRGEQVYPEFLITYKLKP